MEKQGPDAVSRLAELVDWNGTTRKVDVTGLEAELGIRLPSDFKQLLIIFPYGEFQESLRILHPGWLRDDAKMANWVRTWGAAHQRAKAHHKPDFVHDFFPEPHGLLPWADLNDDLYLCWLTKGDPSGWPIVVFDRDLMVSDPYAMSAAEFLEGVLTGSVTPPLLAGWRDELTKRPITFDPI